MNNYEMTIILGPDREEKDVEKLTQELIDILKNFGAGEIISVKTERRSFAYPIKKHREGTYIFIDFQAPPTLPEKIRQELYHREDILRLAFFRLPSTAQQEQSVASPSSSSEVQGG